MNDFISLKIFNLLLVFYYFVERSLVNLFSSSVGYFLLILAAF